MPRYVAFLRAINVGGHVVKMARLKELFDSFGFAEVETLIASGNVIFRSPSKSAATLEQNLEELLQREVGYEVKTFIRSEHEIAKIAEHVPFSPLAAGEEATLYIGFLKTAPERAAEKLLLAAQTSVDEFHIAGRELYWRCKAPSSESIFSGAKLEKMLGMAATLRNVNTVRRLAAKYPPAAEGTASRPRRRGR